MNICVAMYTTMLVTQHTKVFHCIADIKDANVRKLFRRFIHLIWTYVAEYFSNLFQTWPEDQDSYYWLAY